MAVDVGIMVIGILLMPLPWISISVVMLLVRMLIVLRWRWRRRRLLPTSVGTEAADAPAATMAPIGVKTATRG